MPGIAATADPVFPIAPADRGEAVGILMASLRTAKSKRTRNAFLGTLVSMETLNMRERQLAATGAAFGSQVVNVTALNRPIEEFRNLPVDEKIRLMKERLRNPVRSDERLEAAETASPTT